VALAAWPRGTLERSSLGGEDGLAGLAGEVAHLLEHGLELAAVCDPLAVQSGVLGRQPAGDGLPGLLPSQLPIGAVPLVGAAAAAVGVAAGGVKLGEAALADEADLGQARLDLLVVAA
jgi:hypothetical protein